MTERDWPRIAVVTLNWNNYEETADCLESLTEIDYPNYDVVVVDNASTDGSGERLAAEFEWCEFVFADENRGFGGGCNAGIDHALDDGAEYVLLVNNDAAVEDGHLRELVEVAEDSGVGVVGALVRNDDGEAVNATPSRFPDLFFYSGYRSNLPFVTGPDDLTGERWWETDRVEGAGVLLGRDLLRRRRSSTGAYLDDSLFMYCEEVELAMWCRQRGLKSVIAENAVLRHEGEASSSRPFQLYYLTRNRVLIAHRYFDGVARLAFDALYAASRLALAGRYLKGGNRDVARAILSGLVDGYRGRDGKRKSPS